MEGQNGVQISPNPPDTLFPEIQEQGGGSRIDPNGNILFQFEEGGGGLRVCTTVHWYVRLRARARVCVYDLG